MTHPENDTDTPPVEENDRAEIQAVCADHDFPLETIDAGDELLRLVPASLEGLPNADQLQQLADDLEDRGFRFVTFVVPDAP